MLISSYQFFCVDYSVLTSVDRDDPRWRKWAFCSDCQSYERAMICWTVVSRCILQGTQCKLQCKLYDCFLQNLKPEIMVECLTSDFQGDLKAVETLVHSDLDVFAHYIETIKRLQRIVGDPWAGYVALWSNCFVIISTIISSKAK